MTVGQEGHYFIAFALHPGHVKRIELEYDVAAYVPQG